MIVAEIQWKSPFREGLKCYDETLHAVRGVANRGDWWGNTYAVAWNIGLVVVVEAANESEVLDNLVDSHLGHIIIDTDKERIAEREANETQDYAGNYGLPICLDDMAWILPCKVHYFVNKERFENEYDTALRLARTPRGKGKQK